LHGQLQFSLIAHSCGASYRALVLRSGFELYQPPVSALRSFLTPLADMFFVSHLGVADVSAERWSLAVGGLVKKPLELTWSELRALPRRRVMAAHECAGSPLAPTKPVRRVGNVEWEGVPLSTVLEMAGIRPEARYLWSRGADTGEFNGVRHAFYEKDLPIDKALDAGTLLATHINGEPLPPERGGPVRLVVPGFYGTNSTKWLKAIELREERSPGYFTTTLYNDVIEVDGQTVRKPVWAIAPHSVIVSHEEAASVSPGAQIVEGWAWAACGVAQAEVSLDGGASWTVARLESRTDFSWQRFALEATLSPRTHRLLCRATANDGAVQPSGGARNEWFSVRIHVRNQTRDLST
jgi:DMSO/TMAO reductase YedYZ molybdopterin-dependent catalytic subunit